eukprot:1594018-Prymnesium_polylepis.1
MCVCLHHPAPDHKRVTEEVVADTMMPMPLRTKLVQPGLLQSFLRRQYRFRCGFRIPVRR